VGSVHDNTSSGVDITLLGNRPGGEHVVSCARCHTDAGLFTSGYGLSDTFSERALDVSNTSKREVYRQIIIFNLIKISQRLSFLTKLSCYLSIIHKLYTFRGPGSDIAITQRDRTQSLRSVESDGA
jgi:hypothetical protein